MLVAGSVVGCMSAVNAQMSRDGLLTHLPLPLLVSERALEGAHRQPSTEQKRRRISILQRQEVKWIII